MVITDYLQRNARPYGSESALVEINPSEERDNAFTWRDFNLIENANPDAPYHREMSWRDFDRRANRFANLLLSRGLKKGAKAAILLMNCSADEINAFCAALPRYKRPRRVIFDRIPRNPTGRIEKPALREKYRQGRLVETQVTG